MQVYIKSSLDLRNTALTATITILKTKKLT